jgi:hypothetical protein
VGNVFLSVSMSLDGFITALNDKPGQGLGEGGEVLHDWVHGEDFAAIAEVDRESSMRNSEAPGRPLSAGGCSTSSDGWDGAPPGGLPCFVLTRCVSEKWAGPESPFTFVTAGIESAVKQAMVPASGKSVLIGGGAYPSGNRRPDQTLCRFPRMPYTRR